MAAGRVVSMSALEFRIHRDTWLSANDRHHWARKAQRTRDLRHLGGAIAKRDGLAGANLGRTQVFAHIGYPRAGKVDPANAYPTIKALIDGMVDAGVWADDDSDHIVGPDFRLDVSTRDVGMYSVRLVLMEATT